MHFNATVVEWVEKIGATTTTFVTIVDIEKIIFARGSRIVGHFMEFGFGPYFTRHKSKIKRETRKNYVLTLVGP